jgi:hypothetical protein
VDKRSSKRFIVNAIEGQTSLNEGILELNSHSEKTIALHYEQETTN